MTGWDTTREIVMNERGKVSKNHEKKKKIKNRKTQF
jgi:hypothetical protein